jgi:hypothetical protein
MRTPDHACSTIASVHSSSRRPNLISKRAGEEGLKNPGPNFDLLAPETRARRSTASPGEKTGARLEWKRGQSRRRCRTDPDPIPLRQSIPQAPRRPLSAWTIGGSRARRIHLWPAARSGANESPGGSREPNHPATTWSSACSSAGAWSPALDAAKEPSPCHRRDSASNLVRVSNLSPCRHLLALRRACSHASTRTASLVQMKTNSW